MTRARRVTGSERLWAVALAALLPALCATAQVVPIVSPASSTRAGDEHHITRMVKKSRTAAKTGSSRDRWASRPGILTTIKTSTFT